MYNLQTQRIGIEISNSSNDQSPGFSQTFPATCLDYLAKGTLRGKAVRLLCQPAGAELLTTVGFNKISTSATLTHILSPVGK